MATINMLNIPGLAQNTSNAFRWALIVGSRKFGFNPDYLAAVMRLESNFDPSVQNALGAPALGLIQFWRDFFPGVAKTARRPDVSWEDLRTMSAIEQLPFVFAAFRGKGVDESSSPGDYYMANFLPAFVGYPPDFVLGEKGSSELLPGTRISKGKLYEQNFGLDADKDGRITVSDITKKMDDIVNKARSQPPLAVEEEGEPLPPLLDGSVPASSLQGSASSSSALPFKVRGEAGLPVLRYGSIGAAVGLWQRIVNSLFALSAGKLQVEWVKEMSRLGFDVEDESELKVDGDFGRKTFGATRVIQRFRAIPDDGEVGPMTWERSL